MNAKPTRRLLAAVVAAVALTASVVACTSTRAVGSRGPSELVPELIALAAATLGVPRPLRAPLVVQLDPAAMRQMACETGTLPPRFAERGFDVGGLYARGRGIVAVSRGWRADDPVDVACLLHELAHYVQDAAGIVYPCPAAEADAYGVQRRFLEAAGLSFERVTGITAADSADLARCAADGGAPGADAAGVARRLGRHWGPPSGIHPSEGRALGPRGRAMQHVYDRLGVRRRINGAGTLTRLGGGLMPPEVVAAMAEAAASPVDIAELQAAASRAIARATGAEAGIVTSGAAAALTLGTAACLTGLDAARMDRLPDTAGMADEVIMCRTHRSGYDHAIRAAGAKIVEVGFNDRGVGCGVRGVEPWEIEAAITPNTVAVAYVATPADDPPLAEVAAVADAHGLPVLVDAAAQLPPADNLRRFVAQGAALVAFSGGKAIRGPQASGILCGRRDLIAAALLQQLDMDVAPETWSPPPELIPRDRLRGLPHHGLGRGFKVGKEEIVGLIVALERFVAPATAAEELDRFEAWLTEIAGRLDDLAGVYTRLLPAEEAGGGAPVLEISLVDGDAWALSRALQAGDPPIHLGEAGAGEGVLLVKPGALREGDAALIAERLIDLLSA